MSSPAKVYEYLAMGFPVVASSMQAHEKILKDGVDSLLYPVGDEEELADQLDRLSDDQELWHMLSSNARTKAEANDWFTRYQSVKRVIKSESR